MKIKSIILLGFSTAIFQNKIERNL